MNTCRFFFLFVTLLLTNTALFSQNKHFIKVIFEGAKENDPVYLSSTRSMGDSTVVKNREAQFSLSETDDQWDTYFITYKGKELRFDYALFHNAQSDITLVVDNEFGISSVSGDSNAIEQNKYYTGLKPIAEQLVSLRRKLLNTSDPLSIEALKKESKAVEQSYNEYPVNWVFKHRSSPFSVAVIRLYIDQSNIKKTLDLAAASCFDTLLPEAKINNHEVLLLKRELSKYSDKYSLVAENTTAPPFQIKDTAENFIKSDGFKGKWLLIDFWASWCGPCRANNPLLKQFYAAYRNKGLEVISISIDTDSKQWKRAVIQDKMNWHQGSDLSGRESGVGRAYQINGVPSYFLVSPEGIITARSVGGDIHKMEEILKMFFTQ